eukprot:511124_1
MSFFTGKIKILKMLPLETPTTDTTQLQTMPTITPHIIVLPIHNTDKIIPIITPQILPSYKLSLLDMPLLLIVSMGLLMQIFILYHILKPTKMGTITRILNTIHSQEKPCKSLNNEMVVQSAQ